MPDLREARARLARLRTARDEARSKLRRGVFALRDLDAAIAEAERTAGRQGSGPLERLRREREAAARQLEATKAGLSRAQTGVRDAAATLFEDEPQRLIEQMDDAVPFLLLPLRIETKFA